jgi:acyl-CoA thioesterase I
MPSRRQVPQQPLTPNRRTALGALSAVLAWPLIGCSKSLTQAAIPSGATVLAFGDSITHGTGAATGEDWPTLLAARTGWNLVNAGVPGDTAQGGRARIASLLSQHQPALVIVGLGGNDFLRSRPADQVKEDLRDILRQVKSNGTPVVLLAVPAPSLLAAVASQLSDAPLYQALAEEEGVVLLEDVISTVLSDNALKADPIHPNAEGYRRMAQDIYLALQASGFVAR